MGRCRATDPRAGLPPPWPVSPLPTIRGAAGERTVLVLDDDPTGTQTVRDVTVLIDPSVESLAKLIERRTPLAFILTNSRSLPADGAARLAWELGRRISRAARLAGHPVSVISRSDSTLRGHFPGEVDGLAGGLGWRDVPVLLMPFFGEGGRITIDDVHYVVQSGRPVPVAETEYARDSAFGYAESNLEDWVRSRLGRVQRPIGSLPLNVIRAGGPPGVAAALSRLGPGAICIANAVVDRDAEVVAAAVVEVERSGQPMLPRTAAGFVRARAGQVRHQDLRGEEVPVGPLPGLVVVGSHVPSTSRQLARLLDDPPIPLELVELPAAEAAGSSTAPRLRRRATQRIAELLATGRTPIVATTRERLDPAPDDPSGLALAARISRTLVGTVRSLAVRPGWILAKGGITSSDVATAALGARSATVLGQLLPGVPVWRVDGGRHPGLVLVVFPGNVGDDDALRRAVAILASPPHERSI
jgi:uncharacterized protein YgbK (DUF1537 family)